jgi:uncharacterized protein
MIKSIIPSVSGEKSTFKGDSVLLEFGFKNFFSFREGASISFRLDANAPESVSQGRDFATVLAIKGANASGKTQILKAISFLGFFCTKSFSSDPGDELMFSPFYDSTEPTEFFVELEIDGVEFRYELSCTEKEVLRETVFQKKAKRVKIYERLGPATTPYTTKSFEKLRPIKLRGNASVISTAHQYELSELEPLYTFFKRIAVNVGFGGLREKPFDIKQVSKVLKENEHLLSFVRSFVSECDSGVDDIVIQSGKDEAGKEEFYPIFIHKGAGEESIPITHHTESSGTKALFRVLPLYKMILDLGGVLALDEFDVHLHPHILPKLLDLFLDEASNPKHAQLLFTTHDTEILDQLGRYRVYLVNKADNESFAYRLDEIPGEILRNDRSIVPAYREGKIGGVPRV